MQTVASCVAPFRAFLCALLLAMLAAHGPAVEVVRPWILPPLDGELAGEFTPLLLPGAPALQWRITVRTAQPRVRTIECTVEGPGLKLRGGAALDPRGEGTWNLAEAEIDLAQWFDWIAPQLGSAAVGLKFSGTVTLRGAGTWREGVMGGRADVTLRDGRLEDPAHKVLVEGLGGTATIEDLRTGRTAAAQVLTWRGGHYDVIPIGAGRVEFAFDGERLRVSDAVVSLLGGELQSGSLVFSLTQPEFAVTARIRGIDLAQVLFLLPPVLAMAQGRLDGHVALRRDGAGFQIGVGQFSMRPGESVDLRFAPTPGLLSSRLPDAIRKHYPGLTHLEMGGIPLRAELLDVTLTPTGDADGRTATVHIIGGPIDPNLRAPVDLSINVRGSLDSLVKFGSDSRLRFGGPR